MFSRDEIASVRLEPSLLGGFVVHLIDFDGRTLFFQRLSVMGQVIACLKAIGVKPPERFLAA